MLPLVVNKGVDYHNNLIFTSKTIIIVLRTLNAVRY